MQNENPTTDAAAVAAPSPYTFGDGQLAAERLERLAALFAPAQRALLAEHAFRAPALAYDLGCGPGHTTRVLAAAVAPRWLIGLDTSQRYLELARRLSPPEIEYRHADVTALDPELPTAELVYVRFLLTHLAEPDAALAHVARLLARGGRLLVQETATIASEHPVLARYYELVGELQRRHGQRLEIGRELGALVDPALYRVVRAAPRELELDGRRMARLHAMNLPTWRTDPAARSFDPDELDRLGAALQALADDPDARVHVRYALGELVLERL